MSVNEIAFTWSPIAKAGSIARLFVSLGRRCMAHMVFLSAPQRRKDTNNVDPTNSLGRIFLEGDEALQVCDVLSKEADAFSPM